MKPGADNAKAVTGAGACVASPCIGACAIGSDGVCAGCLRTLDEIAEWGSATDVRKRLIHAAINVRRNRRAVAGND